MASPSRGGDDQLVGNYRISHEIGKGSFAKVYKAIYIVRWGHFPFIGMLAFDFPRA